MTFQPGQVYVLLQPVAFDGGSVLAGERVVFCSLFHNHYDGLEQAFFERAPLDEAEACRAAAPEDQVVLSWRPGQPPDFTSLFQTTSARPWERRRPAPPRPSGNRLPLP